MGFTDGYKITLKFDLQTGWELKLCNIFQPNGNYLQVLSDNCVKELNDSLWDVQENECDWPQLSEISFTVFKILKEASN